jgi:DNA-binding PadR family transcriptional regulator
MEYAGFKPKKLWLDRALVKSEAFRSLSGTAVHVYFDILRKARFQKHRRSGRKTEYIIINNGEITYSYKEAEKNGFTRPRFVRALDELIEKGLIDITHQGSGGIKGDTSKYAISERWRQYGTERFEKKTRRKDRRQGRGFLIYWARRRREENLIKMRKLIRIRKRRRESTGVSQVGSRLR